MEQNWVKRSTTLLMYIVLPIGIILACGAVETPPAPPPPAQPIAPAAAPPAATALPVQKAEAKKAAQPEPAARPKPSLKNTPTSNLETNQQIGKGTITEREAPMRKTEIGYKYVPSPQIPGVYWD